jgi:quinol-cytochrome oxidoreductase complex cytochrome b subunit
MKYTNPVGVTLRNHLLYYPTPASLSYFWNFGSLAGLCLIIQILSGLFLAMHYTADTALAFDSVEHIMRDVNFGWLLRYTHANGASVFLLVVYIHIARGLFFRSYVAPREYLWYSGVVLFLLLMATAFLGYVLPWGQMSLWGATVITSLASALPVVGEELAYWLWGGYSVDNATLTRFFTLHFLIPFVMVGLTLLHLVLLHVEGSTNPLGLDAYDFIPFYPYFVLKDVFGFLIFLFLFSYLVFFEPNLLGHPDNYIRANAQVTPHHIVPEWYFLPFYAMLRSCPSKLGGVAAMASAIGILFFLPSIDRNRFRFGWLFWRVGQHHFKRTIKNFGVYNGLQGPRFRPYFKFCFSFWVFNFFLLGYLGGSPVEFPFPYMGAPSSCLYFFFFFFYI